MKSAIAFLLILTLLHSATITGSIYSSDTFEKVNNTILKFDGKVSQQIISPDGDYSMELEKGEYNITAMEVVNGKVAYLASEQIIMGDEGQTFDIVLFPISFFEDDELPNLDIDIPTQKQDYTPLIAGVGLIAAIILFFLAKKYLLPTTTAAAKKEMGDDETNVLRIIKENEGRMEQKALRDILKYSESKMSLILTELEVTGHIKRFKKGRENIIKLKKEM